MLTRYPSEQFETKTWPHSGRLFGSLYSGKEAKMSKRDAIFPANRHALYDEHRYSAAIRSGDLLFVSGQVGSRDDGSPEPVFEDQVRRALLISSPFSPRPAAPSKTW